MSPDRSARDVECQQLPRCHHCGALSWNKINRFSVRDPGSVGSNALVVACRPRRFRAVRHLHRMPSTVPPFSGPVPEQRTSRKVDMPDRRTQVPAMGSCEPFHDHRKRRSSLRHIPILAPPGSCRALLYSKSRPAAGLHPYADVHHLRAMRSPKCLPERGHPRSRRLVPRGPA